MDDQIATAHEQSSEGADAFVIFSKYEYEIVCDLSEMSETCQIVSTFDYIFIYEIY